MVDLSVVCSDDAGSNTHPFDRSEQRVKQRTTLDLSSGTALEMRQKLKKYFLDTFETYELLFECLSGEAAYYKKPIRLRHPLIFYYGHTATFYINKLNLAKMIDYRVNKSFESTFAVGVDEMSWDDLDEKNYTWPSVVEVKHYRDQVKEIIVNLIDEYPLSMPIDWDSPWWAIVMGIEHELIHLETSSVLIRQHALEYVHNHPHWLPKLDTAVAPENTLIHVEQGKISHFKNKTNPIYGWDNEFGEYESTVEAFYVSKYLVSNQEFIAFIHAQGYLSAEYWDEEGWSWRNFAKATHPAFWVLKQDQWYLRLMTQEVEMPWDWPVEVNYHEAKAFCNWKSKLTGEQHRLPTEDEWYRLYAVAGLDHQSEISANLKLSYSPSSCAVNKFQHGDFFDVQGNVWQWTETAIYPYEKFAVHPIYDDFSTPTFDGKHNLMKGGSWISCGNEAHPDSRYAFRRHFFQHAGFRYVVSQHQVQAKPSYYESDTIVSQYLNFHYGAEYFGVQNLALSLMDLVKELIPKGLQTHKALDLGCATGRASFELARYFDHVIGVDFSARFIRHSVELQKGESIFYTLPQEGSLVSYESCNLKGFDFYDYRNRVEFLQGDACNLKPHLTGFDFVFASNLIDRLPDPKEFLISLNRIVNLGGVVLISSPYTWDEQYTPMENWLGGIKKAGENFSGFEGLKEILEAHFELVQAPIDVPFVIKETHRKFQHTLAQATLWKRVV